MLILTRKLGEKINIGDDITVTLLESKGAQATLWFQAAISFCIHRHEIYEKIREENLRSSNVSDSDLSKAAALL